MLGVQNLTITAKNTNTWLLTRSKTVKTQFLKREDQRNEERMDPDEVTIWRVGQFFKVYAEDTGLVRQLGRADNCRLGASYFERGRLVALDCIMPFKAKFGRRIFRILKVKGFRTPSRWPNLAADERLTLKRVRVAMNEEATLEMAEVASG